MANVRLQDLTAIIHNTSRFNGGKYDLVHVENLIQTDTPIDPNLSWYVPNGETPSSLLNKIIKSSKIPMYPRTANELLEGTQDIVSEAQNGKLEDFSKDLVQLSMLCALKKTSLTPLTDTTNLYLLSYDFKLFPDPQTQKFMFVTEIPFKGLQVAPNGGKVQLTVTMPIGSKIDVNATKGTASNNKDIQEQIITIPQTSRTIVVFHYQIDPKFDIIYNY